MIRSPKKGQAGQAAVEFALIIVFLVVFLISFLEITALVYTYSVLPIPRRKACASSGARHFEFRAMVPELLEFLTLGRRCESCGSNYLSSLHDKAAMTVTLTYPDGSSKPSSRVRVVVSYPYQPFFGLGWPTIINGGRREDLLLRDEDR
jgi:hypothetical protein